MTTANWLPTHQLTTSTNRYSWIGWNCMNRILYFDIFFLATGTGTSISARPSVELNISIQVEVEVEVEVKN
jgi:hypothetical protein